MHIQLKCMQIYILKSWEGVRHSDANLTNCSCFEMHDAAVISIAVRKKSRQNNRCAFTGEVAVCIFSLHISQSIYTSDMLNPELMRRLRTTYMLTAHSFIAIVSLTVELAQCTLHYVSAIYWTSPARLKVHSKQHTGMESELKKPCRISCRFDACRCANRRVPSGC